MDPRVAREERRRVTAFNRAVRAEGFYVKDVATMLDTSRRTLRRWIATDSVPWDAMLCLARVVPRWGRERAEELRRAAE